MEMCSMGSSMWLSESSARGPAQAGEQERAFVVQQGLKLFERTRCLAEQRLAGGFAEPAGENLVGTRPEPVGQRLDQLPVRRAGAVVVAALEQRVGVLPAQGYRIVVGAVGLVDRIGENVNGRCPCSAMRSDTLIPSMRCITR
jgi:hypothetical protein